VFSGSWAGKRKQKKEGGTYSKPRFGIGTWACFREAGREKENKKRKEVPIPFF